MYTGNLHDETRNSSLERTFEWLSYMLVHEMDIQELLIKGAIIDVNTREYKLSVSCCRED